MGSLYLFLITLSHKIQFLFLALSLSLSLSLFPNVFLFAIDIHIRTLILHLKIPLFLTDGHVSARGREISATSTQLELRVSCSLRQRQKIPREQISNAKSVVYCLLPTYKPTNPLCVLQSFWARSRKAVHTINTSTRIRRLLSSVPPERST